MKDIDWFSKADLSKYKGEYVVILDKKIVAHGKNAKKVWEEAKARRPSKKSVLAKIPEDETLVLSLKFGAVVNGKISLQKRKI